MKNRLNQVLDYASREGVEFLARRIVLRHCAEVFGIEDYTFVYEAVVGELMFLRNL